MPSAKKLDIPERGDVYWLDLEPQSGKETTKRRPVLIVSTAKFNRIGLAIVCPISSVNRNWPSHVTLPAGLKTKGVVMTEQVKSLDFRARNATFIEKASFHTVQLVLNLVRKYVE